MSCIRLDAADFDARRFRPNFVLDPGTDGKGFVEFDWAGKTFRLGSARIRIDMPTVRCVMTTLSQPGLEKDPSVLRTIVSQAEQNLGVYASVIEAGEVRLGDVLEEE